MQGDAELARAAERLRRARHVVVFSGAGMSAESGIATFRDADGLWNEFPPERFATWPGLLSSALVQPRQLAQFVIAVLEPIATARPNAGHHAVGDLEQHTRVTVITQNIDGLHQAAGSTTVWEIHGSLYRVVSRRGRLRRTLSRRRLLAIVESLKRAARSRLALPRLCWAVRPMLGIAWRGLHRPGVVLFGQAMAEPDWSAAQQAVAECHCMISVGTSGLVMPAAMLPQAARAAQATLIHVDPAGGPGDLVLRGTAANVLPRLVDAAFGGKRLQH